MGRRENAAMAKRCEMSLSLGHLLLLASPGRPPLRRGFRVVALWCSVGLLWDNQTTQAVMRLSRSTRVRCLVVWGWRFCRSP